MCKIFTVDLHKVFNEHDLIYRFNETFNMFYNISREDYKLRVIQNNVDVNWDAFSDDFSGLYLWEVKIQEIKIIIYGMDDVRNILGDNVYNVILQILSQRSDPSQRTDWLSVFFQIRGDF